MHKDSLQAYCVSCIIIHKSMHGLWPCTIQNTSLCMWRREGGKAINAVDRWVWCRGYSPTISVLLPSVHHFMLKDPFLPLATSFLLAHALKRSCSWATSSSRVYLCECVCNCVCVYAAKTAVSSSTQPYPLPMFFWRHKAVSDRIFAGGAREIEKEREQVSKS